MATEKQTTGKAHAEVEKLLQNILFATSRLMEADALRVDQDIDQLRKIVADLECLADSIDDN